MSAAFPSVALVRRELLSLLRGPRAFGLMFLFAAVAIGVVWLHWPRYLNDPWMLQHASRELIQVALYTLFAGTVLAVPAFAAGAIVLERERGTYDFLRMSLAKTSGVLVSKLINAVGLFVLLILGVAPIISTGLFLPGVDLFQFLAALSVIFASAVSCAAVGLMFSSFARRSLAAIALSYAGVAAIWFMPLVLTFLVFAGFALFLDVRSVSGMVNYLLTTFVPYAQLVRLLQYGSYDSFVPSLAYQMLATGVCLAVAGRRLSRPMNPPKVELRKPLDDQKVIRERRTTWPYYLVDPLKRKKPIEDRRNPMLVREVRWGLINRGTVLIRLFYVAATIYFFAGVIAATGNARDYESMTNWMIVQIALTVLVTPALTANAVTKELELGNLDMLRITLLRPSEFIVGKFMAAAFTAVPLLAASVLALIPMVILASPEWTSLAIGYVTLVVCIALSLSIAIYFSTAMRRTLPAIVLSYVVSAIVFIAFGNMVGLAVDGIWLDLSPESRDRLHWTSPLLTYYVSAGDNLASSLDATRFWITGMAIWSAVAALFIGLSVLRFSRTRMRDP